MGLHPLAGKPAPYDLLVNVTRLISAYYTGEPDPTDPAQGVAFGASGHRGSSLRDSFNDGHILAIPGPKSCAGRPLARNGRSARPGW